MLNSITRKLMTMVTAVAMVVLIGIAPLSVSAAPTDYRFELVDQVIHAGEKVQVRVRLVQIPTGRAIINADMEEPKLAMRMAGMTDMRGHAMKMAPDAEGNYRVVADVVAPGEWLLELAAKVPEEKSSVQGSLKLQVVK